MTDWRRALAAARVPAGPETTAWDFHWTGRFDRHVAGGKTPNQAIPIAWRLTVQQHGERPEQRKQET